MAATQLEIPFEVGFTSRVFQPTWKQQITPSGGGNVQVVDRSIPLWRAEYTTGALDGLALNAAQDFFEKLEGSAGTFLGYDPKRIMPFAYKGMAVQHDPWTKAGANAPKLASASYANGTITLTDMAEGAIVTTGDLISVYMAPAWWLFRARQTLSAANNGMTIKVGPLPRDYSGPAIPIRYRRAVCEMKIIGEVKPTASVGQGETFSFKAVQYIRKA